MQEDEVSFWAPENQKTTEGGVPSGPPSQYGSSDHAKTSFTMPYQAETEMEVTRWLCHNRAEPSSAWFHGFCTKPKMGDGYHVYPVRKFDHVSIDLFNNEIVAHKMYDHQQTPLVMDTLKAALAMRGNPEGVIIHSDQGSVYTSYAYQELVKKSHLVSSMSRRGNCWDNAVIESFHSTIKSEEFQYVKFNSLHNSQVREMVDEYIRYYNEDRILEKLGYLTPKEFGAQAA